MQKSKHQFPTTATSLIKASYSSKHITVTTFLSLQFIITPCWAKLTRLAMTTCTWDLWEPVWTRGRRQRLCKRLLSCVPYLHDLIKCHDILDGSVLMSAVKYVYSIRWFGIVGLMYLLCLKNLDFRDTCLTYVCIITSQACEFVNTIVSVEVSCLYTCV